MSYLKEKITFESKLHTINPKTIQKKLRNTKWQDREGERVDQVLLNYDSSQFCSCSHISPKAHSLRLDNKALPTYKNIRGSSGSRSGCGTTCGHIKVILSLYPLNMLNQP